MIIIFRYVIRWMSYPLIFGGTAAFMVWALYTGIPPWPTTLLIAIVSLFTIAALEQILARRSSRHLDRFIAYAGQPFCHSVHC